MDIESKSQAKRVTTLMRAEIETLRAEVARLRAGLHAVERTLDDALYAMVGGNTSETVDTMVVQDWIVKVWDSVSAALAAQDGDGEEAVRRVNDLFHQKLEAEDPDHPWVQKWRREQALEAENARLLEVMWRWAEFSLCATTRQALREACELSPTHDNSHKAALAARDGEGREGAGRR